MNLNLNLNLNFEFFFILVFRVDNPLNHFHVFAPHSKCPGRQVASKTSQGS